MALGVSNHPNTHREARRSHREPLIARLLPHSISRLLETFYTVYVILPQLFIQSFLKVLVYSFLFHHKSSFLKNNTTLV